MATRALHKGGGEPRFADPGRARDQQIVVIPNPAARAEAQNHLTRQAARRGEIDILERRGVAQLGLPQALRQSPLLSGGPFRIDQEAEAVVKPELGVLTRAALLIKRRRHRGQV